jgi:internalin A
MGKVSRLSEHQIFIGYSHTDKVWLDRLLIMLEPLIRSAQLKLWVDTQMSAGAEWFSEIQHVLSGAKVAVLLVSPNFLASNFILKNEMPQLLAAAEKRGLTILWIAISASLFEETPIAKYKALNNPARPLDRLSPAERNEALVKICQQIKECINSRAVLDSRRSGQSLSERY